MKHQIDKLDKKILRLISRNARIPFLEVARECNVSGAAIHQRVQKLSNLGVIKRSEFVIDTYKIGYQTCAFIGVTLRDHNLFTNVIEALQKIDEIVECHYTTGRFAIFLKVYAKDNRDLLNVILRKISNIEGVKNTETFQMSLDEIFNRQLSVFDTLDEDEEVEAETEEAVDDKKSDAIII